MYTLHKLPEGFIVTSDEEPKEKGWFYNPFIKEIQINCNSDDCFKIIAQQDQIDFSDLSEEDQEKIGWYNVHKLAKKEVKNHNNIFFDSKYNMENYGIDRFTAGFQKAQELLSDRMFTFEDIKEVFNNGIVFGKEQGMSKEEAFDNVMKSLSQPKSWKVEGEWVNDKFKILRLL